MTKKNRAENSDQTNDLERKSSFFLRDPLSFFDAFGEAIIVIDVSNNVIQMNSIAETLTGYSLKEAIGKPLLEVLPIQTLSLDESPLDLIKNPPQNLQTEIVSEQLVYIEKNLQKHHLKIKSAPVHSESVNGFVLLIREASEDYQLQENLRISEERYQNLTEMLPVGLFEADLLFKVHYANSEIFRMFHLSKTDIAEGLNALGLLAPESQDKAQSIRVRRFLGEKIPIVEYTFCRKDGSRFPGLLYMTMVSEQTGEYHGFRGVVIDITQRKKMENKLKYLSMHDALTKLYNRAFFEEEMQRLERNRHIRLGIVVCDVDGLKLINETMGHQLGDKLLKYTASILRKTFGRNHVIARIGGDEFAVLLQNVASETIQQFKDNVQMEISKHNASKPELHISLSIGYAIDEKGVQTPSELFRIADRNMYHNKLHQRRNSRGNIIQALLKTLETRRYVVPGHGDRIQKLVNHMADKLHLTENQRRDLELLSQFHDLGKIGLRETLLMKKDPLSEEEIKELQEHSEIGYRIALTISDLAPVAEFILKHHERWDGLGYPLGLQGENIPLESRIIAIVDAYDSMTHDRPYKKALSHEEAVEILRTRAGFYYDPELIQVFLSIIS